MAELSYKPGPLTVHDYRDLPEGGPRCQLVDGDFHMAPSPNVFHQEICLNIGRLLSAYLDLNPIGKIFLAPLDVFLTETNVYQPDLLFVSRKKMHLVQEDGIHGAPDLVIEILSPSTVRVDLGSKKRVYARCGVHEYWAIDPVGRSVAVFNLRQSDTEPQATWIEGDRFDSSTLPGVQVEVEKLFVR